MNGHLEADNQEDQVRVHFKSTHQTTGHNVPLLLIILDPSSP